MVILIVVESKNKTKKIDSILGKNYKTVASVGHIIELDPKKMSVDLKTFEPDYKVLKGKENVIKALKKKNKKLKRYCYRLIQTEKGR